MTLRPLLVRCVLVTVAAFVPAAPARAQAVPAPAPPVEVQPPSPPPPPPPGWAGSLGAGWAATSGNADTSTFNVAYELLRDYGGDLIFKSTALYLRGDSEQQAIVDRAAADARLDYRLTPRLNAFVLTGYARDRFKDIDYLISQSAGISVALVEPGRVEWTADTSVGVVVEKNTGFTADTDGAWLAGERFLFKITDRSRITQAATGLWKMDDFEDAYFTFSAGIITSVVGSLELKLEFQDTYKRRPTDPTLEKNDQSIVMAAVYKF
jgi:putative salt-induced outer membrane protein YdiY